MRRQSSVGTLGRLLGLFALVGLGLGLGALTFLWVAGVFEPTKSDDPFAGLGQALLSGVAIGAVLVFASLVGVIVAALGAVYISRNVESRRLAAATGAMAGGIGHIAMVAVLGIVLLGGVNLLSGGDQGGGEVASSPSPSPEVSADPECVEIFGLEQCEELAQAAQPEPELPEVQPAEEPTELVDTTRIAQLFLGFVPAALVGLFGSMLLFVQSQPDSEVGPGTDSVMDKPQ